MILSLDTHVLLWWLADDPTLSQTIRAAISDGKNLVLSAPPSRGKWRLKARWVSLIYRPIWKPL